MKKRIYGLETEYGIIDLSNDSFAEVTELNSFFEIMYKKVKNTTDYQNRFFYLNGAYIYLETTGKHPEYATPECASIKDLIRWDKAGERIFEEAMTEVNQRMIEDDQYDRQIRLYKNNTSANGIATYGCHENYLVSRRVEDDYLNQCLIPFLVSRQILCGSGYVNESGFKISQRSNFIHQVISSCSTDSANANRPIIHNKDEPLADKNLWRRLHLILGDANMAQISTFLKTGATSLVLRMIENKFLPKSRILKIQEPVEALKKINADPTHLIKVFAADSENDIIQLTAIQIQRIYLNWAKEYFLGINDIEPEWQEIIEKWETTLNVLEENPMNLFGQIDWVTKKHLMELIMEKHGFDWNGLKKEISGPEAQRLLATLKIIDLCYHDIRRNFGLYNLLENEGLAETIVSEEEIENAKTEPPNNTRANWRTSFLNLAKDNMFQNIKIHITNWDNVNLSKSTPFTTFPESYSSKRDNPLDATPPNPEEILRKLNIVRSLN